MSLKCKLTGHKWNNYYKDIEVNVYNPDGSIEKLYYRVIVDRKCTVCNIGEIFMKRISEGDMCHY